MEMKNPVHPGALIKECLDDLGLSFAEAAQGLDVTRQQLHNVITGRSRVTPEMAIRLEKAIGSTADTWLRMQANFDLAKARKRSGNIIVSRLAPKVA
jgi:antitoxin HigA-1